MKVLALDLGTDTGFAFGDTSLSNPPNAGTWSLASKKEVTEWGKNRLRRRADPRIFRLFLKLQNFKPDLIIFEDVEFSTYTYQCQLWASFRGAIWCAHPTVQFDCVNVSVLKQWATGSGSADKEKMATALYRCVPELKSAKYNDDAVDAIWLWRWAKSHWKI